MINHALDAEIGFVRICKFDLSSTSCLITIGKHYFRTKTYRYEYQSCISHYDDVIMGALASLITSLTIVYSTVNSDQRKHQSSASLAFVREFIGERWIAPHRWPVTRKMFPFDDVIMGLNCKHPVIYDNEAAVMWMVLLIYMMHCSILSYNHWNVQIVLLLSGAVITRSVF